MERVKKALEALDDPKNEPIKWLLGAALKQHAEVTRGRHFLLGALARTPRPSMLVSWNVYIHQVRELLANPETAPQKALLDLKSGPTDAEEKLLSFMAEIQAPLHLKKLGYEEFRILLPSTNATPDFDAKFERREARIEVKNLQEPTDIVRTVAANHWRTLQDRNPGRYNFRVVLKHQHRGQLSLAARKRLRSILDVLPETKKKIEEVLDGNVHISIEKLPDPPPERSGIEDVILSHVLDKGKEGQMVIASGITEAHLTVDVAEV